MQLLQCHCLPILLLAKPTIPVKTALHKVEIFLILLESQYGHLTFIADALLSVIPNISFVSGIVLANLSLKQ